MSVYKASPTSKGGMLSVSHRKSGRDFVDFEAAQRERKAIKKAKQIIETKQSLEAWLHEPANRHRIIGVPDFTSKTDNEAELNSLMSRFSLNGQCTTGSSSLANEATIAVGKSGLSGQLRSDSTCMQGVGLPGATAALMLRAGYEKSVDPWGDAKRCVEHPTEPTCLYCDVCSTPCCPVCFADKHAEHFNPRVLSDVTKEWSRLHLPLVKETDELIALLNTLKSDVNIHLKRIYYDVEEEISQCAAAVENKRQSLHADTETRAARLRKQLEDEKALCEQELERINGGRQVLRCLAQGSGTVDDIRPGGRLIHGEISWKEFEQWAFPVMHTPQRIFPLLRLQLPRTKTHEMCALIDWTQWGQGGTEQVFPPDNTTANNNSNTNNHNGGSDSMNKNGGDDN